VRTKRRLNDGQHDVLHHRVCDPIFINYYIVVQLISFMYFYVAIPIMLSARQHCRVIIQQESRLLPRYIPPSLPHSRISCIGCSRTTSLPLYLSPSLTPGFLASVAPALDPFLSTSLPPSLLHFLHRLFRHYIPSSLFLSLTPSFPHSRISAVYRMETNERLDARLNNSVFTVDMLNAAERSIQCLKLTKP